MVAANLPERLEDLRKHLAVLEKHAVEKQEMADRAGVLPKQYSSWINEKGARPSPRRLEAWADREGWPPEIFAEGGPMPATAVNGPVNARKAERGSGTLVAEVGGLLGSAAVLIGQAQARLKDYDLAVKSEPFTMPDESAERRSGDGDG